MAVLTAVIVPTTTRQSAPGSTDLCANVLLALPAGTGQNMFGLNWGNGFISNQDIINSRGLSDPNDFFQDVLRKPYVNSVVFSPHLYPPSITMATFLGTTLWEQCRTSFGYLQTDGKDACLPPGHQVVSYTFMRSVQSG